MFAVMNGQCKSKSAVLPCFCDDFRCYICRGPADGVERSVHHSRQTKVSQLQAFAAVCMLIHLSTNIHMMNAVKCRIQNGCRIILSRLFIFIVPRLNLWGIGQKWQVILFRETAFFILMATGRCQGVSLAKKK